MLLITKMAPCYNWAKKRFQIKFQEINRIIQKWCKMQTQKLARNWKIWAIKIRSWAVLLWYSADYLPIEPRQEFKIVLSQKLSSTVLLCQWERTKTFWCLFRLNRVNKEAKVKHSNWTSNPKKLKKWLINSNLKLKLFSRQKGCQFLIQ